MPVTNSRFLPRRRIIAIPALLILGCTAVSAVDAQDVPGAEELLDRHVQAVGGVDAFQKLSSRVMQGKLTVTLDPHPQLEADFQINLKNPDQWHLSVESPGRIKLDRVYDGSKAWEVRDSGEARVIQGTEKHQTREQLFLSGNINWREFFSSAKTIGAADVDGKPAWEVQVTTKGGETYTQFLDQEDGYLVKYVRTLDRPGGRIDATVYLHDYRAFDGFMIPTRVEQLLKDVPGAGDATQVWEYQSVSHNAEIPDTVFQTPEGVQGG